MLSDEPYIRASRKQLDYISSLSKQLGVVDEGLYTKLNMKRAAKLIRKLKRKIDKRRKQQQLDRQLSLL